MTTVIEVTQVDEVAAQRLADATGRVTYLSTTPSGRYMPATVRCLTMTTDRDEAVAWGESVAFVPQQKKSVVETFLYTPEKVLGERQVEKRAGWEPEPEPQLRVVRVLELRGPQSWIERTLANSGVSETEPRHGKVQGGSWEIVEQIRTTERLCRHCGGEHLDRCSEDECSANERKGRY